MKQFITLFAFICLSILLTPRFSFSIVTNSDPVAVGFDGQLLELNSFDNVVMRIPITADVSGDILTSLQVVNGYWGPNTPAENADLTAVKLWYVPNDVNATLNTTTAQFVGLLTSFTHGSGPGWQNLSLSHAVADGSTLYVTVDIPSTATVTRECAFQVEDGFITFQTAGTMTTGLLPMPPNVFTISSFYPATDLNVNYTQSTQLNLSTNQAFTPLTLLVDNIGSSAAATAPIYLQGITVTVKDDSDTMIAPDLALQKIGVFGIGPDGPVYGEAPAIPSTAMPIYIPFSTTVTVSNDISLDVFATTTSNTITAVASFLLEIEHGTSFDAMDALSFRDVTTQAVTPNVFPFQSNLFTMRCAATQVQVYHTPILTGNDSVFKGQTAIEPMGMTFINPGVTNTAQAEISKISLSLTDGSNNPLVPNTVFSKIAIAGQGITYGELATLPDSGNQMIISLSSSFISVPVYQPITATVVVDILSTATATEFKLTISNATSIVAQDGNSRSIIPVMAAYSSDPFPMSSDVIPIATSFNISGLSVAPGTVYPQSRHDVLELTLTHPGPTNVGNLLLHGITVTAKDQNNQLITLDQDIASIAISDTGDQILGIVYPSTSSTLYIHFNLPVSVPPFTTATLYLEQTALASFSHQLMKLSIDSKDDVEVTQPSDPTRSVFVAGLWPIESTVMSLGGGEGNFYLSNYPNPFAAGYQDTTIAFYLTQASTVCIKIFTLQGDQVQIVLNNKYRSAGAHTVTWDGRTASGSAVKNGVYLIYIESVPVTSGDKVSQMRKIAVVK